MMTQTYVPLGAQVAQRLRLEIVEGRIPNGVPLTEDGIAKQFGVSRGPARDAIRSLTAEGLLEHTGRRVLARSPNEEDIVEMYALREALETIGLHTSLQRAHGRLSKMLDQALEQMHPAALAQDTEAFTAADLHFHHCFIRAAGLRRVDAVWQQVRPTLNLLLTVSNEALTDMEAAFELHRSFADLIRNRDSEGALSELQWHLGNSRDNLLIPFIRGGAEGAPAAAPTK